jgi:hypothetical protein
MLMDKPLFRTPGKERFSQIFLEITRLFHQITFLQHIPIGRVNCLDFVSSRDINDCSRSDAIQYEMR